MLRILLLIIHFMMISLVHLFFWVNNLLIEQSRSFQMRSLGKLICRQLNFSRFSKFCLATYCWSLCGDKFCFSTYCWSLFRLLLISFPLIVDLFGKIRNTGIWTYMYYAISWNKGRLGSIILGVMTQPDWGLNGPSFQTIEIGPFSRLMKT